MGRNRIKVIMLNKDGSYIIYRIQYKKDKGWRYPNFDHFSYPDGFGSSGDCWQLIGVLIINKR